MGERRVMGVIIFVNDIKYNGIRFLYENGGINFKK